MSADAAAQVEAQVGGHLVVAGAPVWSLPAHRTDALGQLHLHVHVDVLVRRVPLDGPVTHVGGDGAQAVADGVSLLAR